MDLRRVIKRHLCLDLVRKVSFCFSTNLLQIAYNTWIDLFLDTFVFFLTLAKIMWSKGLVIFML